MSFDVVVLCLGAVFNIALLVSKYWYCADLVVLTQETCMSAILLFLFYKFASIVNILSSIKKYDLPDENNSQDPLAAGNTEVGDISDLDASFISNFSALNPRKS